MDVANAYIWILNLVSGVILVQQVIILQSLKKKLSKEVFFHHLRPRFLKTARIKFKRLCNTMHLK